MNSPFSSHQGKISFFSTTDNSMILLITSCAFIVFLLSWALPLLVVCYVLILANCFQFVKSFCDFFLIFFGLPFPACRVALDTLHDTLFSKDCKPFFQFFALLRFAQNQTQGFVHFYLIVFGRVSCRRFKRARVYYRSRCTNCLTIQILGGILSENSNRRSRTPFYRHNPLSKSIFKTKRRKNKLPLQKYFQNGKTN